MPDELLGGATRLLAVDLVLRGALVAMLALLALTLWRDRPRVVRAQAGAALALGLSLATLGTAPAVVGASSPTFKAPWVGLALGNAVLFALFVRALFDDTARWRAWQGLAWLAVTVAGAARCAGGWPGASGPVSGWLAASLDGVPLACAAWVVGEALARWRDDLVERRRHLRWFVALAGSVEMVAMVWLRAQSPPGRVDPVWVSADVAVQLLIAATLAASLLRLRRSELFPRARPVADALAPHAAMAVPTPTASAADVPDPHAEADARLADALARLMDEQRVYREEGLTVAALAQRLAVPEYRLRRVINQRLGHRHFSGYVNGLRLQDALAALADPARRAVPVLTIALDAGFQSIGPFNRAFKAATGLTPTEFRRRSLAES